MQKGTGPGRVALQGSFRGSSAPRYSGKPENLKDTAHLPGETSSEIRTAWFPSVRCMGFAPKLHSLETAVGGVSFPACSALSLAGGAGGGGGTLGASHSAGQDSFPGLRSQHCAKCFMCSFI